MLKINFSFLFFQFLKAHWDDILEMEIALVYI
jgi:hypothetical protein